MFHGATVTKLLRERRSFRVLLVMDCKSCVWYSPERQIRLLVRTSRRHLHREPHLSHGLQPLSLRRLYGRASQMFSPKVDTRELSFQSGDF